MPDDIEKSVEIQPLNLVDYGHMAGFARIGQIIDPNNLLRNIVEPFSCTLAQSFCHYTFDHRCWSTAVYISVAVSLAVADMMYATAARHFPGRTVLEIDLRTVILNIFFRCG